MLKVPGDAPYVEIVVLRPLASTALRGIVNESARFDRSTAEVARLSGAASAAETAETVQISSEAYAAHAAEDSVTSSGLESAFVDTRVAKYAYIANLKTLQTSAGVEQAAAEIVRPKPKQK